MSLSGLCCGRVRRVRFQGYRCFFSAHSSGVAFPTRVGIDARSNGDVKVVPKPGTTARERYANAGMRPPGVRIGPPFVIIAEFDPVERGPAAIVVIRA